MKRKPYRCPFIEGDNVISSLPAHAGKAGQVTEVYRGPDTYTAQGPRGVAVFVLVSWDGAPATTERPYYLQRNNHA